MSIILTKSAFIKRAVISFIVLLIWQCVIAGSALWLFEVLPSSITGVHDDHSLQRASQQGAINLLLMQINQHQNQPLQEIIENLQPQFGYPLHIRPIDFKLKNEVKDEFEQYDSAYDDEQDMMYARVNDNYMLQLGPVLMHDVHEANRISFTIFLLIWLISGSTVLFILIYLATSQFWKDFVDIRQTAEQLSQGNLKARVGKTRSWLFKPLSNVINEMSTHIEYFLTTSQTISHAMAHELRTPLSRIRFELNLLDEAKNKEEKQELRQGIDKDLDELESLIKTSLDYFKMRHNKLDFNLTQVSLKDWSNKLFSSIEILKPDNFTLTCECKDETAFIDLRWTDIIVKNLLLNAFKYAKSKAILSVTKQENGILIEVDDDGPGIPLLSRENIFMPFARLDTSRTKTTGGYGLGLAYVKLIAELHYGDAFVVTSPLGGAKFVVNLNLA